MQEKVTKTALGSFLLRVLFCAGCFLVFSLACSGICFATPHPTGYLKLFALLSFLLSGALSGFLGGRRERKFSAFLPMLAFAMLLLAISLIVRKNALPLSIPLNLVCYLAVGGLFFLLGCTGKRAKEKRHRSPYGRK